MIAARLRCDPVAGRFQTLPLPGKGALVRHIAVDPERGAVWLAYGAAPGIAARVARVVVKSRVVVKQGRPGHDLPCSRA